MRSITRLISSLVWAAAAIAGVFAAFRNIGGDHNAALSFIILAVTLTLLGLAIRSIGEDW